MLLQGAVMTGNLTQLCGKDGFVTRPEVSALSPQGHAARADAGPHGRALARQGWDGPATRTLREKEPRG